MVGHSSETALVLEEPKISQPRVEAPQLTSTRSSAARLQWRWSWCCRRRSIRLFRNQIDIIESSKQFNRLSALRVQDNVALIAVLEALEPPQPEGGSSSARRQLICIANTHIHANPELNDVKLWQV